MDRSVFESAGIPFLSIRIRGVYRVAVDIVCLHIDRSTVVSRRLPQKPAEYQKSAQTQNNKKKQQMQKGTKLLLPF
jgi:hypothetical protein